MLFQRVVVFFQDFKTYNEYDYMSFYEGSSSEVMAKYYGDLQPFTYYSTGNQLVMKFRTSYLYVRNGFIFSFEYVGKLNYDRLTLLNM